MTEGYMLDRNFVYPKSEFYKILSSVQYDTSTKSNSTTAQRTT